MDELTQNWQSAIIAQSQEKLSRKLTQREIAFIEARLSYLGLEFVEDSVRELDGEDLESFLNTNTEST